MIPRLIEPLLLGSLASTNKILIILGARQVGKTTLLKSIEEKLKTQGKKTLYLNCDIDEDRSVIDTTSLILLKKLTTGCNVLLIDEIQKISNAGLTLKILYDNIPEVRIITTGSSSFELKNKLSDALTGRYLDFILYPISFAEIANFSNIDLKTELGKKQADQLIPSILTYGLYPEIYLEANIGNKKLFLQKIVESYLFRDILTYQKIRYPKIVVDLAKAVAYQIGSEINEQELSNRLKIDRKTVISYLDILEKSFVITRVSPYSKNPRREIGRNYKVYFCDPGVRNALIGDFNQLEIRSDIGSLWENFLIVERAKILARQQKTATQNFWRSYAGAEVDYIEREGEKIQAFEFKWKENKLSRGVKSFSKKYITKVKLINSSNYHSFITQ